MLFQYEGKWGLRNNEKNVIFEFNICITSVESVALSRLLDRVIKDWELCFAEIFFLVKNTTIGHVHQAGVNFYDSLKN